MNVPEEKPKKRNGITAFTLLGLAGYGVGGAAGRLLLGPDGSFFTLMIMVGLGGFSLGLAVKKITLAVLFAILNVSMCFQFLILSFALAGIGPLWVTLAYAATGAAIGFGIALLSNTGPSRKTSFITLSMAGAIGFSTIGVDYYLDGWDNGLRVWEWAGWGAIIGIFLGTALGYLEKKIVR